MEYRPNKVKRLIAKATHSPEKNNEVKNENALITSLKEELEMRRY